MNALTRREYDPAMSARKIALLRLRSPRRCAHQDYRAFTYWWLKISVLQRRENRLMERLLAACLHPDHRQSADLCSNQILCDDCGYLRDIMAWGSWDTAHTNCKDCN